ncbi:MAG: FkbM family methyltransferase [Anaerolineae bacterium]
MKSTSFLHLIRQRMRRPFRGHSPASPVEVERAEWVFYLKYLREGMVVFDVGSHVGELTLLLSRFVGQQGRVHAFEASSATFKGLKAVCESCGRTNIILNHVALADRKGMVKLNVYDKEHSSWNSLAERPLHTYGIDVNPVGTEKVLATTIDSYCEENGISRIDLLKIDVEGAEYQVLRGARRMLQDKRVLCCVFEFGQATFDMGNDPGETESYLRQFGYEIRNVVKGDPVFPGRWGAGSAQFSMHVAVPKR